MASPSDNSTPSSPWPHRLAVVTAGATIVLIFVGGLVTNTGSALAVPDWPTTFGHNMFLFPWSQMIGGILYEHTHRLIGSTVGLLTVTMAVWLGLTEPRRWVRVLGLVAVAAVIVQGVLGGLRVVLLEHGLAIVHGCFAQAFLALLVSLAIVTSPSWGAASIASRLVDDGRLRALVRVTVPLIYLQLVFGALLTHTGTRLDAHLLGAGLVTALVGLLAGRVRQHHATVAELRRPATLIVVLLVVQLGLGLGAYLWRFTALSAALPFEFGLAVLVTHRLTGTAIWATAIVLALRMHRLLSVSPAMLTAHSLSGLAARSDQRERAIEMTPATGPPEVLA
jgi:cytochrome c oxidase assembly protein subunit 15